MFASLEAFVLNLVHTLPLELFVVVGSFIEEIIPPIPSPGIMIVAGSVATVQEYSLSGLIVLILLASVGKTVGAFTLYSVTKYAQHHLIKTFGHILNITYGDIERFGTRFSGGLRDYVSLAVLRSIPIIPSVILSFGSGVIKLPVRVFLVGTFIGTLVRDSFYLFVGASGTSALQALVDGTSLIESLLTLAVLAVCVVILGYFVYRRLKR